MNKEVLLLLMGVIALIQALYCLFILWQLYGWKQTKEFKAINPVASVFISVIIAARNEEENIGDCLTSTLKQSYPNSLFEVIVVNDHSEDNTLQIVHDRESKNSNLHHISLPENVNGKKAAIKEGIRAAKGKLIVTTDADCIVGNEWLTTLSTYYAHNNFKLIALPVLYHKEKSFLENLQSLEFTGLMGLTASSIQNKNPILCNGANLAFEKEFYFEVSEELKGVNLASGDDMFLLTAAQQKYHKKIGFLKSLQAIAYTKACRTLPLLIEQRKRWVSKGLSYKDSFISISSLLVYLSHFSLLISLIFSIFYNSFATFFLAQLLIKGLADVMFLTPVLNYFQKGKLLVWILPLLILYTPFVVIIGIIGLTSKYNWKGRIVK